MGWREWGFVGKVFKTWSQEGKLLLAFHMVSTAIKYKMLRRVQATLMCLKGVAAIVSGRLKKTGSER